MGLPQRRNQSKRTSGKGSSYGPKSGQSFEDWLDADGAYKPRPGQSYEDWLNEPCDEEEEEDSAWGWGMTRFG